ncbi:MAG: hypothetical protein JXB88_02160, partial [Spirochaetales bacterium]|nr:hypothetical protein [Spirochaetales bacterium]
PTNYFKEFIVTDSNCFYESYKIYEENKNIIDKLISEGILTTPFNYDNNNNRLLGNPIPYVAGGIDSPRTFNFKMRKQSQARGKYIQNLSVNEEKKKDLLNQSDNTSAGIFMEIQNNALYNGYVNELDVLHTIFKKAIVTGQIFTYSIDGEPYKEMVSDWKKDGNDTYNNLQLHCKPFLPGSNINMKSGYCNNTNSLYYPDKITGVDSIGIVCGVLSMLNVNCILNNKDDSTLGVVNLFNIDSGDNLDEYFNFSSLTAGLEYEGNVNYKYQPVFYPFNKNGINASYLNGDYRFTISDFEKNTIIVPDMKDIRPGDILIKYNYNFNTIPYMVTGYIAGFKDDEIHVGIVVLVDEINDNDSLEMSMDKIYLISVNRNFQMTTLGRWGNENGFGKFAYDPFQYQIRRFLKVKKEKCKKIEDLTQRKEKDPWECVQEYPHHLECHLELPDDEYATSVIKPGLTPDPDDKNKKELEYKNHWIPNTDETEMLEYVRIIINPKSEDNKDITLNDLSISFLPPVDPNFDNFDNDFNNNTLNNINTNRGKGIEICLLKKKWYTLNNLQQSQQDENIPEVKLATFLRPRIEKSGYRDRIITDLNKHVDKYEKYYNYRFYEPYENEFLTLFGSRDYNPYTYNNEDSFFTENGSPRKGALMVKRLAVDGQPPKNYLCYEENSKIYLDFGIKALEFAMPGDDFQLRFFMSGNPAVEGTVGKGDFVAVYDKKLLWRANLYIDERVNTNDGTPSGQVDWNDLNPWSNSENDWNILPSGYTGSEGGQIIELEPFTWHRLDSDLMTNKIIYGSVAYARGDQDEPQAYNEHVLTQQKQEPPDTWEEYLPGGPKFPQYDDLINGVFVPGYASWIWEYRKYIATRYQIEGELWSEWYPFPIPGEIIPTIKVTEDDGIKYCIKMETITKEQKDTLLEEIKNMYTTEIENSFPGQHINVEAEYSKIDPPWSYSAKSAGVDCVGFVFMAAGYKQENGYQYILAKLEPMKWNATVAGARQKFYDPQNLWEIIDKNEYSGKKIELNKVIPGDIIYYEDTPKTFQHVMIVNSVVYEKGTRNTDINYITLIEATLNTSFGCVINDRTIGFYNAHKWTIGRIIMTVIPTQ